MKLAKRRRALRATVGACLALAGSSVMAAASLDLELGAEHSDNVARTAGDEQEETIGFVGLTLGVDTDRPRFDAEANATFEFRRYLDDTFDDDWVGGLDGSLSFAIIPERFEWIAQDNFGQIAKNRVEVETPDNRQNFNYFTTGPDITIPLGARTAAQLSGRWSDTYFEDSIEGSETREGTVAFIRTLSETSTVSINGTAAKTEFDSEDIFDETEINEAFLNYTAESSRTSFSGDAGYSQTSRGDIESGGIVARLNVTRTLTSRSSITLTAGSEFSDTGGAFRVEQDATGVEAGNENIIASGDVFRNTYAYLIFDTNQARIDISATLYGVRERHEAQTILDRDVRGAELSLGRQLTSRFGIGFSAAYSEDEFVNAGFSFDEWQAGFDVTWELNHAWSVELSGEHFSGSGDGIDRDYDENRATLTLLYSIGR
jgi:hypothetical protein